MTSVIHLHVHSHYTLLGGTASIDALVERAAEQGMLALALTDTNALYGAVQFDRACRRAGIQPIIGMAATLALPPDLAVLQEGQPGLVVLLAANPAGYRSLCRLSSHLQGHADREARLAQGLSLDDLRCHHEGLICLDGGGRGWTERLLRAGHEGAARQYLGRLAHIFDGDLYLGLEFDHSPGLEPLGRLLGVPAVAVQPVYCLSRQDLPRLRLLAAIDRCCPLDAVPDAVLPQGLGQDVHWLSPGEMRERFARFPDALARTGEIAARCVDVNGMSALPDGRPIFPRLDLPQDRTPEAALAELAREGFAARYGPHPGPAVLERLGKELAAIARHGYAPLFLVVADVVRWAREADIPVSTRGSVANSLVAFCTGITTVDPVSNDLLFERFLSPARADPPDIDLDFCSRRRDEVLGYVRSKYGEDRVSLVATISTLQLRSAVRETAQAHGFDEARIDKLVADLPHGWHPDPRRRDRRTVEEWVAQLDDPLERTVVQAAAPLVGMPHHLSVHPGGVVITPSPLTDVIPVQWSPKGFLIAQFDHRDVEALGLPKLDLLGIRALTVLSDVVALVRRDHAPDFRLSDIPLDDATAAEMIVRGDTVGVFQCESSGARRTLIRLRARTVYDLAVANAFFKPGPALGGMARAFVRRYRGEEQVSYLHPALEPILGSTKGVLIFQEQILRIAVEIAGLSWAQADHLRRGVKFKAEAMDEIRVQFVEGCQRLGGPGLSRQQAETLWEQIAPFAGYGFNQGHAMAYADVSYRSAYLKRHWPAAFMCARLQSWGGFHHPAMYMAEAMRLGIEVRGPDVNRSQRVFTLGWQGEQPVLWMGLSWVRDLRRRSVREIVRERRRPFASLRDLMFRVSLQRKEIEHLIQCGALDGLGPSRAAMLAECGGIQSDDRGMQLTFDWATQSVEPESMAQRAAWERQVIGYPVSVFQRPIANLPPGCVPLSYLPQTQRRFVAAAGMRLPGWTGGQGFYLWDGAPQDGGATWIIVRGDKALKLPPAWTPVLIKGRWTADEYGFAWLQAQEIQILPDDWNQRVLSAFTV
ncbi:MAG: DNA polymerase III subunit alpha [Anaerolineae bacterium]|nr:DNA polymerase III subunit alpha [Anaerolineae bacterium]